MPFQIQSSLIAPYAGELFEFVDDIKYSLVGLSAFSLSYGQGVDHHVQTMSVAIKVTPIGPRKLLVEVEPILRDESGNSLVDGYVVVSVLAWIGDPPSFSISMPPPITLDNDGSADLDFYPQIAALSGFTLSYGHSDHHLGGADASIYISSGPALVASAEMWDTGGNFASTAQIAAVTMGYGSTSDLLVIKAVSLNQEAAQTIDMGVPLARVGVFMSGFKATYSDGDHAVQTFGAGPNRFEIDGTDRTKVNTTGIWSFVWDDSGNKGNGPCDLVIVGIPSSNG